MDIGALDITLWIAFSAGILSFISPCTLPLYPAYLSYITGISVQDIVNQNNRNVRWRVVTHTFFFLLGVSTIYLAMAWTASFIGDFFFQYGTLIQKLSGILIIVMGLFLVGFFNLKWLMQEKRFQFSKKPVGYLGSTMVGMGFAAGWTPCIGPILSVILSLAASHPTHGLSYMITYIIGFSFPFLILSFYIGKTKWILKYSDVIMKVGGVIMILMGVLLYTDQLTTISIWLYNLIEGTWLERLG